MQYKFFHPNAVADIRGSDVYPNLHGRVQFYQHGRCVLVEANVQGLPETLTGFFGFHIHAGERCAGDGFAETGNHYNPEDTPHPSHAGDLQPLLYCHGSAYLSVLTGRFRIEDVLGRTIVIHNKADDFTTQPAGNAGEKIACGVIRPACPQRG